MRGTARLALLQYFWLLFRRIAILYVSMFLVDYLFAQLMTFLCSSLISLMYLVYELPFVSKFENRLNITNESILLIVTYLLTCVASFQDS